MESAGNPADMSVFDRSSDELSATWGITPGTGLWPTRIRILFVIDGWINLTSKEGNFGLGFVLDTLLAPFSWWTSFEVHVAKRDGHLTAGDLGSHHLTYTDFKFTNAGFNLDSYDQVWFFGHNPFDALDVITDADIAGGRPLDDVELKLLAEWMERGGGVFATGDHSILGASMCSRIPRVRTMRKWKHTQGVPSKFGSSRHQTLQPTAEDAEHQEEDILLQPLELVYSTVPGPLPFLRSQVPHPLLCSPLGVIDRFPDHMHEGEVIADDRVQLDLPLDIPGYDRPEYPFVVPVVLGSGAADNVDLRPRPRPQIVAYGQTTNNFFEPPVVSGAIARLGLPLFSKRFGVVGVYDGDRVGLGRVVVDSTWHHWFSLNLFGLVSAAMQGTVSTARISPSIGDVSTTQASAAAAAAYEKMQAYYRNVGMWLATPAQRATMLISGVWGVLVGSAPMAFSVETGPWEVGERIVAAFGKTVSPCMLGQFVGPFLDQQVLELLSVHDEIPRSEPSWTGLPEHLLNRAMIGGIGSSLLGLALGDRNKRARGERPRLDREAIRQRAVDGVSRGYGLLRKSVQEAATSLTAVHDTLVSSAKSRPTDVSIPIDVRRLKVIAETLQLPDPTDPEVIGRHFTFTIRIRLDDSVVAYQILEDTELPSFESRGSVIDLSREVGEVDVQTGESLTIEVIAGSWMSEDASTDVLRFKDILRGDASTWVGKHVPARSQLWRLWYRIEESAGPSYGS
jgi:hypothetical protein